MFIGHFALGLAAKPRARGVSLAMLFAAVQLADLAWPVLLAIGVEQVRIDPGNTAVTPLDFVSYPYSHSLLALVVWGLLLAWGYRLLAGNGRRAFLIIFGLVVSHWVLDYLTHRPDMPLYPGSAKFGLGLWNSIPLTIAIEVAMFGAGVWLYLRATRARDRQRDAAKRVCAGLQECPHVWRALFGRKLRLRCDPRRGRGAVARSWPGGTRERRLDRVRQS